MCYRQHTADTVWIQTEESRLAWTMMCLYNVFTFFCCVCMAASQATDDCDSSLACCGTCVGSCTNRPLYECSLEHCTTCQTIRLQLQNLSGTIPPSISQLSLVQSLKLSDNPLTGTLPAAISSLTSLLWLSASKLQLSGTLPASLTSLSGLTHLSVYHNALTGTVPAGMSDLQALQFVSFSTNTLTGTIPSLQGLDHLTGLDLSSNRFRGAVPDISFESLTSLHLENNFFTGTIPASWCTFLSSLDTCQIGGSSSSNSFCCTESTCADYLTADAGANGCGVGSCAAGCSTTSPTSTTSAARYTPSHNVTGEVVGIAFAVVVGVIVAIIIVYRCKRKDAPANSDTPASSPAHTSDFDVM